MVGKIIMCVVSFACAGCFFAIGVYAGKLQKPMWFWSGSEVDASKITDVVKYNKENAAMWKRYSLWFFAAGAAGIFSSIAAVILLVSGCSIGIVLLVVRYCRIFKKYSV